MQQQHPPAGSAEEEEEEEEEKEEEKEENALNTKAFHLRQLNTHDQLCLALLILAMRDSSFHKP